MELSKENAITLLHDINQNIEEYADYSIKNIIEKKIFDFLFYPPNCGFTDLEKTALDTLDNDEHLKNALRKVIANSTAGVLFDILNLFDGTTTPKNDNGYWTGIKLVDEIQKEEIEPLGEMLHDKFLETYWEWKSIRGNKGWKLDTYEGND